MLFQSRFPCASALAWLILAASVSAQDRVLYYDHAQKKETDVAGAIDKESLGGLVVAGKTISAHDVIDVVYDSLRQGKVDYNNAVSREKRAIAAKDGDRRKQFDDARTAYQEALRAAPATASAARRHIQFRLAILAARLAEGDPTLMESATKELALFHSQNGEAWQTIPCLKALAKLHAKTNRLDLASKTLEELTKLPVSADTRLESELWAADLLMLEPGRMPDAEKRLQTVVRETPPESARHLRAVVALGKCEVAKNKESFPKVEKQIAKVIDESKDPDLKAFAYNTLGDCYLLRGQAKDALYSYLWVDLIYPQNKEQHAKAMVQLAHLFRDLKDEKRAMEYEDKLKSEK